jgi:hypothetical protein
LNGSWRRFAVMVDSAGGLDTIPESGVRGGHFRHRIARAERTTKLPEWPVRHARHGRYKNTIREVVSTDLHDRERLQLI